MDELELFDENPNWRRVLQSYQDRRTPDAPWVSRMLAVENVDPAELSGIHGKLIALGFLKFDLDAQSQSMRYQPTPLGRNALLPPEQRTAQPDWQVADDAA